MRPRSTAAASLGRRQALLRWRVYICMIFVLPVGLGGPILIIRMLGWHWWTVMACLLLIATMGQVVSVLLPRWTLLAQQARGLWLLEQAKASPRAPILLLRSFTSAVTVEPTRTIKLFGTQVRHSSATAPRSHLLSLATHVRAFGPVVAIGVARRGIAVAPRVDVLMFEPVDKIWFEVFKILSAASRAVLMLPGETVSVACEYDSLKSRQLLSKLVLVMPPHGRFIGRWRVRAPFINDNLDELKAGWTLACANFKTLGVTLPPYDPSGLAFTIDHTGGVKERLALSGSFVRIERAVEVLVPAANVDIAPLGETMRRLEPFGLSDG